MNQLLALSSLLLLALNLTLFLLPGFAITLALARRREWSAVRAAMVTVAASAALGYIAFWLYFESRVLGRVLSFGVVAVSIVFIAAMLAREPRLRALVRELTRPFVYVLAVAACYTCLLFLFKDPFVTGAEFANVRFFSQVQPGDNQIPLIFAERIYAQAPLEPFCCGDWRSSDRPPLQAGIFLLQRPLKVIGNVRLNYQLLGTGLQCLWICGVWVLLKTLRAPPPRIKQVFGFLVFSGFLFYNSVYVWPKLLAATFVLFSISILFEASISRRPVTWFETGLAALSFALAMLAHPGSVFSAPAIVLLLISTRHFVSARKLVAGVGLIVIFVAPWLAYQRFYDPPGNRLLKMHLAGVGQIDSRSTWQTIEDSYESLNLKTILAYKWGNAKTLIGPHPFVIGRSEDARSAQREYVWNALGVLNAGWVALLLIAFRKNMAPALPHSGLLIGMAILNLLVWCVVLIGPAYTLTEHGSYADQLLLSVGLLGFLLALPRAAVLSLFALQILNFFAVWVFIKPALISGDELQIPLLVIGLAAGSVLAWHFGRSYLAHRLTS
ncbi:MAG TPA: hypothetical protein VMF91_22560 [Bryobacteraceae bacterium]|nr:hypothetical protein [Bryobacteraceae bacterium]